MYKARFLMKFGGLFTKPRFEKWIEWSIIGMLDMLLSLNPTPSHDEVVDQYYCV